MTTLADRFPRCLWRTRVVAVWLLLSACGDDDARSSKPRDASVADAAAEGGDGSADAATSTAEIESKLTEVFSTLDRTIERNCGCYVEMGAYTSIDECLMWQASRPDWAPCTATVFERHPEGLDVFQCLVGLLEKNAECLATKPCEAEARAECDLNALECLNNEAARTAALEVGTACPDISLLPRQQ